MTVSTTPLFHFINSPPPILSFFGTRKPNIIKYLIKTLSEQKLRKCYYTEFYILSSYYMQEDFCFENIEVCSLIYLYVLFLMSQQRCLRSEIPFTRFTTDRLFLEVGCNVWKIYKNITNFITFFNMKFWSFQ